MMITRKRKGIPDKKHSPEVGMIMLLIMDPFHAPTKRFRDEYSSAKTAIAKPFVNLKLQWNTGTNPPVAYLPVTDMGFFLFRNFLRWLVYYIVNPTNASFQYIWFNAINSAGYSYIFNVPPGEQSTYNPIGANQSSAFQPHGPIQYAGNDEGQNYLYIDGNNTASGQVVVNMTYSAGGFVPVYSASASTGIRIDLVAWFNGSPTVAASATSTGASNSITLIAPYTDYFNLRFTCGANGGNTVTASPATQGSGGVWGHLPAPAFNQNSASYNSIRMISEAYWWKNESSVLNASGLCASVQVGKGEDWKSWSTSTAAGGGNGSGFFNKVLSSQDQKDFRLAKGLYGFLKPTESHNFDFQKPVRIESFGIANYTYPLDNDNDYLVAAASESTIGAGDTYLNLPIQQEWTTDNTIFDTESPSGDPAAWRQAVMNIAPAPQFFSNAQHTKSIGATIGGAVGSAIGVGIEALFSG